MRSPRKMLAPKAVQIGIVPVISADTPASTPNFSAEYSPANCKAWNSSPATIRWPTWVRFAGQGARVMSATSSSTSAAMPKRRNSSVNGPAYGKPILPTT